MISEADSRQWVVECGCKKYSFPISDLDSTTQYADLLCHCFQIDMPGTN